MSGFKRLFSLATKGRPTAQTLSYAMADPASASGRGSLPRRFPRSQPAAPAGRIDGQASGECQIGGHNIAYALQVGFCPLGAGRMRIGVRGWALDRKSFVPVATLVCRIAGQSEIRLAPEQLRGDIMNHFKLPVETRKFARNCGFETVLEADLGEGVPEISLALEVGDVRHEIGKGHPGTAQFIEGLHGWLFLAGDSNDSPAQFTQAHQPSDSWVADWNRYFAAFTAMRDDWPKMRASFLVAPSKESVMPDYYPLPHGGQTPLDSLLDRFGEDPDVHYPLDILVPLRELSFDRIETHWSDFGARKVCEALLENWKRGIPNIPDRYHVIRTGGDLGFKAVPLHLSYRTKAAWPEDSRVIFDNFVLHHGRVRISHNPKPKIKATVALFGGSSSEHMECYFRAVFERVVYVYSAGAWDPEILTQEKPDYVVLQTSERFLTRAPEPVVLTREVVHKKVSGGYVTRKTDRAEAMAGFDDPSVAFYHEMG
ncbi:hypothetical protein [Thioclava kandeliae]|uniref:AlgX/AlgJ SGNH hydrolase-like domain-containing protein n=1 Tax=Thioclava kandeliae TaxID=3070818 RepID=A0ABV1SM48_9RHOB